MTAPGPPSAALAVGAPAPDARPSTAVLFVHGMGSQRRLQEVSKLVEKLDQHNGRKAKTDLSYGGIARA